MPLLPQNCFQFKFFEGKVIVGYCLILLYVSHCLQINQLIALFRRQCKKLDIFVNQQMLTLFEIIAHHGTYNLLYTLLSLLNTGV